MVPQPHTFGPTSSPSHSPVKSGGGLESLECGGAYPTKKLLWPANNQFETILIRGVTDPEGYQVRIIVDTIYSDEEPTTAKGVMVPDAFGVGTSVISLRARRSGGGNGRVYTIDFTASDGRGNTCQGSVKVGVPHDQNKAPIDDGPVHRATPYYRATKAGRKSPKDKRWDE